MADEPRRLRTQAERADDGIAWRADLCQRTPGCGYPPGHTSEHPCGQPHTPGSPCRFCEKPTPADGGPCPDCWRPIPGNLADAKALLAQAGLSLNPIVPPRRRWWHRYIRRAQ